MDVKTISMDKVDAEKKLDEYSKITNKEEKYLKQLRNAYSFLKDGKKLVDIYDVFKNCGTKGGLPKFAIARADRKTGLFLKRRNGAGSFGHYAGRWRNFCSDVVLPKGTFRYVTKKTEHFKTKTPIIPLEIKTKKLKDLWVLWEVEDWEKIAVPPADPILLVRISKNLFAIIASWDLTPLERAIVRGR